MSTMKWSLALIGVAALGTMAGYRWALRSAHNQSPLATQTMAGAAASADGSRKILYWHDPMKPEVKFDKPGKSPFMDMPLVPVYGDDGAGGGGVTVSPTAQQNLGIRLGQVEKRMITAQTVAIGTVRYDEQEVALVQTRVAGFVTRLHVRAALERVKRGQILAEIVAPAWTEAEGEYVALLQSDSAGTPALRDAARRRLQVLGVSDESIAELQKTQSVPTTALLVAPIDGVVTELGLREGASFEAGAVLFRLNGTANVWVDAQVPETQARAIAPGAAAELRAAAFPGEVFRGRVQSILPQVDTTTRTVGVRLAARNPSNRLAPGMFVQTTLAGIPVNAQLWVPSEALIATGERSIVIVKRPGGAFDVVDVTTGAEVEGKTAVLTGLTEGESVVLSGQFLIDSEASLKSAIHRLTGSTP